MKTTLYKSILILFTLYLTAGAVAKASFAAEATKSETGIASMELDIKQLNDEIAALEKNMQETDKAKTNIDEQLKLIELMQQNLEQDIQSLKQQVKKK